MTPAAPSGPRAAGRVLRILALLAVGPLALAAGQAGAQRRVVVDRAQIIVNNKIMTAREVTALKELQRKDFEARLKGQELQDALKILEKTVTEKIVENLLLEIRAEELGIVVNDKEIDQRVETITRRDPGVSDVYTEEQLKDLVYKDVLRRQVMQREVSSRVRVDDEDVKKACLASSGDDREVEVGHILVRGQDDAAQAKARAIRADLVKGADFEQEALAKSEDPSVAVNKGRLGFISRGQFVKEFEERAFSMKPRKSFEVFKTCSSAAIGWRWTRPLARPKSWGIAPWCSPVRSKERPARSHGCMRPS